MLPPSLTLKGQQKASWGFCCSVLRSSIIIFSRKSFSLYAVSMELKTKVSPKEQLFLQPQKTRFIPRQRKKCIHLEGCCSLGKVYRGDGLKRCLLNHHWTRNQNVQHMDKTHPKFLCLHTCPDFYHWTTSTYKLWQQFKTDLCFKVLYHSQYRVRKNVHGAKMCKVLSAPKCVLLS